MPLDQFFASSAKPKMKSIQNRDEPVEMQLGRSDFLLGEPMSKNPFPKGGYDHTEWQKGWLAQKSLEPHNPLSSPSQPIKLATATPPRRPDGLLGWVRL